MSDEFTTIRVFKKDKDTLLHKFNGPAHEAMERAMETVCNHPEKQRRYLMVDLPLPSQEAFTADGERLSIGGFYCGACHNYIFPDVTGGQVVVPSTAKKQK